MQTALDKKNTAIDQQLEAAIDPWLQHMKWRADFEKWRNGRIWQENKQSRTLETLRMFMQEAGLGTALQGLRVLDLGCGMGGLTVAMAREGALVQPFDYNPAYCEITRLRGQRYQLDLQPVNGGGENLPFADGYFDIIVCMDVLEHVQRPQDLFKEVSRCLKPGGLLYITAINRFAFNDPHYHARFVNWLPRRLANPFLELTGRKKDNSRFTDRQTLQEMHYYRFDQLPALGYQYGFERLVEFGELEWGLRQGYEPKKLAGLKSKIFRGLRRTQLLGPVYKAYRFIYKSTYQLMYTKGNQA